MSASPAVRTFNVDAQLPEELTGAAQWIVWQYRAKGEGKATKVPVDPVKLKPLTEWQNNPSRWWTFEQAVELYQANPALSGIGIVLTPELGLIGLDLDDAFDETGVAPWAKEHVADFDTYTEVSPSGAGLRMFAHGALPAESLHNVKPREIYSAGRWLTITGRTWNDSPITERTAPVDRYLAAMQQSRGERAGPAASSGACRNNAELVASILRGDELHDSTRDYAFRLIDDGLKPGKVVETLRGIMLNSAAREADAGRWQERYDDIPRTVESASAKAITRQAEPTDPNWGFVSAVDMVANMGPTRWLVQKLVPEDCTFVLYGPSGSLKSFVMLDIGLSVANGVPWQDKHTKRRSVYYLAGEGKQGFAKRIAAWCEARGVDPSANFAFRSIPRLQDASQLERLLEVIEAIAAERDPPGLIVIDTLFTALDGGDENSGKDMGGLISAMVRIRERFGAAVAAVHHTGKVGDTARGHSSLPSGMDVMVFAKPGPVPLSVELTNPKQKDGAEHPSMLLQATVHELPIIGEDGMRETSLVLSSPTAELLAGHKARTRQTEERAAKAQAAKQDEAEARDRIKAFALERMAERITLETIVHEVEDLAVRLGFPHLAKKKTTLSDWRKAAGL